MKLQTKTGLYSKMLILILAGCLTKNVLANNEILLMGSDGKQHAFSEYIGKGTWTLVNLWGVHCPPCRVEMPELVLLHDEYSQSLVSVLGIAIDFPSFGYPNMKEVKAFLQEFMVDFPILLSDANISRKLGAGRLQGLPTSYVFTPEGELVGEQLGAIDRNIILDFIKKYKEKQKVSKNQKMNE
jgi:thiol-disulfide isomerase/thioredoxin